MPAPAAASKPAQGARAPEACRARLQHLPRPAGRYRPRRRRQAPLATLSAARWRCPTGWHIRARTRRAGSRGLWSSRAPVAEAPHAVLQDGGGFATGHVQFDPKVRGGGVHVPEAGLLHRVQVQQVAVFQVRRRRPVAGGAGIRTCLIPNPTRARSRTLTTASPASLYSRVSLRLAPCSRAGTTRHRETPSARNVERWSTDCLPSCRAWVNRGTLARGGRYARLARTHRPHSVQTGMMGSIGLSVLCFKSRTSPS